MRDEQPLPVRISGEPATVAVETGETSRGGERVLITVDHPKDIDLEGAIGSAAELTHGRGDEVDPCRRTSLTRVNLSDGRARTRALFTCRWPLSEPVSLALPGDDPPLPVLLDGGLPVMGERPWLLSGWVRGEMGVRVTGVPATRGVDIGANLGARGLLWDYISLGGRGDILVDTQRGGGEVVVGPEFGFTHPMWPCGRCSFDAALSYVLGYTRGFAEGPEFDLRFGYRVARTGTTWHGIEAGVGYRHLIGPESGGSLIFTLSYSRQTALRRFLPDGLRAPPSGLPPEPPQPLPESTPPMAPMTEKPEEPQDLPNEDAPPPPARDDGSAPPNEQ